MTIAFGNSKGGVGKTTLTVLVAAMLKEGGHDVALEDRDPQQSATECAALLGIPMSTGSEAITIIDTAPSLSDEGTRDAFAFADQMIIVTSPAPLDLAKTQRTVALLKTIRPAKAYLRAVLNKATPGTISMKQFEENRGVLGVTFFKQWISRREAYARATLMGISALSESEKLELYQLSVNISLKA